MAKQKPSAPKGMRDFGTIEMQRRNYIFSTIKHVYEKYAYQAIETPAMEKLETLTGKYGEEGDRLIFKVLNSGDYLKELRESGEDITAIESKKATKYISEKALRYDLTVPFARFVVQYQSEITFPFKRYQIQPVWRADNPQKGRYREFYQCDADVIGSDSLINEVEFVQIFNEVFNAFQLHDYVIKVNNRKILSGIAEVLDISDRLIAFTVSLDKIDKIGAEKVIEDLRSQGFSEATLKGASEFMQFSGSNDDKITFLRRFLQSSSIGQKGLDEIEFVLEQTKVLGLQQGIIEFDISLARGLNYYTGCIFEVKINNSGMGSVCGGGRYDNLTGIFGLEGISGVGISFGADRIYDILLQRNLYPNFSSTFCEVLFLNFGDVEALASLKIAHQLRAKGVKAALYPDTAKIKKQFSYADAMQVQTVCTIGSDEMQNGTIGVKNMQTGEQITLSVADFLAKY